MPFICGYMGKITKDPEIKQTQSGKQNCRFSIANEEGWGSSRKTDFIPCIAWEKTANTIVTHFKKGDSIIVSGNWTNNPWQKNEKGYDIPNWQFVVNKIHFLPKAKISATDEEAQFTPGMQMGAVPSMNESALDFTRIEDSSDLPF